MITAALLDDLRWARTVLVNHTGNLRELVAARDLWLWHYRFDKDPERREASLGLEALYESNDLARIRPAARWNGLEGA